MPFIQIIEYRTGRYEEVDQLGKEWEAASPDTSARRRILVRDRDDNERYLNIVFFDSYEEAMQNSADPITQQFAERMAALVDGPPRFENLEVIDDVEL